MSICIICEKEMEPMAWTYDSDIALCPKCWIENGCPRLCDCEQCIDLVKAYEATIVKEWDK